MIKKNVLLAIAAGLVLAVPALAQDVKVEKVEASEVPRLAPSFSDADMGRVAGMLTGSWKANVSAVGGGMKDVVISFAPVRIDAIPNTVFAETAEAGSINRPFRQEILQFYRAADGLRMRTLEPRRTRGYMGNLAGLWAVPAAFPQISADDLVATMDYVVTVSADGFTAKTPHPYPTATGGAFNMSSDVKMSGGSLMVADRGSDASGKVVWGPAAGSFDTFTKFDTGVKVSDLESGLYVIDFKAATGEAAKPGDIVKCHYAGYLEDGRTFDTSYDRGTPFTYSFGQPLIEGWNKAMSDTRKGAVRRLVIPGPLAYGVNGRKPIIPSNATLIFDIEVLDVTPPAPIAPPAAGPEVGNVPQGGSKDVQPQQAQPQKAEPIQPK